jgi:streptogramin lyase
MKRVVNAVRFFAPFMLAAACCALLAVPAAAAPGTKAPKLNAEGIERSSKNPSGEHPFFACPPPTANRMTCDGVVIPPGAKPLIRKHRRELGLMDQSLSPALEGSGPEGGFSPADLRSAYNVPEAGGKGVTIAIVDAWNDPRVESDLNAYREHFGLPPCTTANGCFRKVNQKGEEANYPPFDPYWPLSDWALETDLDLDMASATCPECKLLLVEANDEYDVNLGAAENTAAKLGATEISNSWGGGEAPSETEEDSLYYNHPGIFTFFSSGDSGYGASEFGADYPTSSPNVISVGGTSLNKDSRSTRGWHESAWSGSGSGCSLFEKKPEWQTDKGCSNRTTSDVSAVADPNTPVAVYDSHGGIGWDPGWVLVGGTSASAPLVAGIEARASEAEREKGAKLFWEQGSEGRLFDVTEGYNGTCGQSPYSPYLCSGGGGYDGPTGWGTPGASRPGPPVVGTGEVSKINLASATLNGIVNPNGGTIVTYRFEWGPTTEYSHEGMGTLSSGTSPVAVSLPLSGLTPETTYHYRLWVSAVVGGKTLRSYGPDHTFVTSAWSVEEPLESGDDSFEGEPEGDGEVSCGTPTDCIAVGSHWVRYESESFKETGEGPRYEFGKSPLAAHWNGSEWMKLSPIVPHKIDSGLVMSPLYTASCTSATFCMLMGVDWDGEAGGEGGFPLLERWDGKEFSLAPAAMPSDLAVDKNGFRHIGFGDVSCTSATFCLATGGYQGTSGEKLLTEKWNGSGWTIVANQKEEGAFLERYNLKLSCASSSWCMAIGNAPKVDASYASIWSGGAWSTQGKISGKMLGLSCFSSTSCMAVGSHEKTRYEEWTGVANRWNGSSWEPSAPGTGIFESVSCSGQNLCLAVGHYGGYELERPGTVLVAGQAASTWNGSTWNLVSSQLPSPPQYSGGREDLRGDSCKGGTCMAVGNFTDPTGIAPDIQRLTLNPQILTAPVVSSASFVYEGVQESTTAGTWAGETGSFSYQWQRCNAEGKECTNITGATASTYTPVAADLGKTLVAKVTASGPEGNAPGEAVSKPTAKVQAAGQVSEYALPAGSKPLRIALGPDGKVWFTEVGTSKIGKIGTSGTVTEYSLPSGSKPWGIAAGPDGKLWFTDSGTSKIGRISTSGVVEEFPVAAGTTPYGISADPSGGRMWFTDCSGGNSHSIGSITTGGVVTEYTLSGDCASNITSGPDGNQWFDLGGEVSKVGKITPSGTISLYSLPTWSAPAGITAGPDGNMWFGISKTAGSKIGKISTSGTVTEYPLSSGTSYPKGIAVGPDKNLWFTEWGTKKIGRITTSGSISEYPLPEAFKNPEYIAAGSDNRMWVTSEASSRIAAIVP